jgi:hypothetical protein
MTTVIGIPGLWQNRFEIMQSLVRQDLLLTGFLLMDAQTKFAVKAEIYPHDPELAGAFAYASGGHISQEDLDQIAKHKHTLYLICKSQKLEDLQQLIRIGAKVLQAGGLAVKVETSGFAHPKDRWIELSQAGDEVSLYQALVCKVQHEQGLHTCGMHQFGMRDAIVYDDKLELEECAELLNQFLLYLLYEKPELNEGETFSLDEGSPWYRIGVEECTRYEPDHYFHNPHGLWTLHRVT